MKLRHEINILDRIITGATDDGQFVQLDTTRYNGTVTYYLEIVASIPSGSENVTLRRVGTSTDDATISVTGSTVPIRFRSSSFSPPAGQTAYMIHCASTNASVKSARIIILEETEVFVTAESQIEVGNDETSLASIGSLAPLASPKYWYYDSAKWDGSLNVLAEVTYKKVDAAAPAWQASGTPQASTGANLTVPWPSHIAGDIALLFVECCGGQAASLATANGFVEVTNSPSATGTGTAGTRLHVYWCRATSGSMASPVVTPGANHGYAQIVTFRGCIASGNPWDVTTASQHASAVTTTTWPSVDTTVNNCRIVCAAARDNDSASAAWSSFAGGNISGHTEESSTDAGTALGNGGGIVVNTGTLASAGATGNPTASVTSSINAMMTIALRSNESATIKIQEDNGSFASWADKVTIVNASNTTSATRSRSSVFTPTSGRNYRLAYQGSQLDIYNAKIIVQSIPPNAVKAFASGENWVYGVAQDSTYAYAATRDNPFKCMRVTKSDFTTKSTFTDGSAQGGANECVSDGTYVYVGLDSDPGKIVRILISDWSTSSTLTLASGYGQIWGMVISGGYLYCNINRSPGAIARVLLSDFATVAYKAFTAGDQFGRRMSADATHLYAALTQGGTGKVAKLQIADFNTYAAITLDFSGCDATAVDDDYIYAINTASPGRVNRILKSDFSTKTDLTLPSGFDQPFGIEVVGEYVYIPTYTSPCKVAVVDRNSWTFVGSFTLPSGMQKSRCLSKETDGSYLYFGADDGPGSIIRFAPKFTKFEEQYLLANTGSFGGSTGLKDYNTLFDPAEWTSDNDYFHEANGVSSGTGDVKLQSDPDGTPADVTGSTITDTIERERTSAMTMPSSSTLDVNVTGTGSLYASRIIVEINEYTGLETASVSPVVVTLSVPSTTATYQAVKTASVSPVVVSLSVPTTTAHYVQVGTASVAPVVVTLSVPSVTATAKHRASVAPVVVTLSVPSVSATYEAHLTASVSPVVVALSVPSISATYVEVETASVAPVSVSLSVPSVTALYDYAVSASVAPVVVTLSVPAVTAEYNSGATASVSPVVVTLSVPSVAATYDYAVTASVAPVAVTITVPSVTATYDEIDTASVSPVVVLLTVPSVTAINRATASVAPVSVVLSVPSVTAHHHDTASVQPVSVTLSVPSVTATHAEVHSASTTPVVVTLTVPSVNASYDELDVASVSPVIVNLTVPSVTAVNVATASVSPVVVSLTVPSVNASHHSEASVSPVVVTLSVPSVTAVNVATASVSAVQVLLTVPSVSASHHSEASVSPVVVTLSVPTVVAKNAEIADVSAVLVSLSVPTITARFVDVAQVEPVVVLLSVPSVTATGIIQAIVSPVVITISVPTVTADYDEVYSASVSPVVVTITVASVTATYSVGGKILFEIGEINDFWQAVCIINDRVLEDGVLQNYSTTGKLNDMIIESAAANDRELVSGTL